MAAAANRAVWQDSVGVPGVVRDNSLPTTEKLSGNKVLVKNMINYPLILGCDIAGTVEAVVPGSTAASKFRVGHRVFGFGANEGFQDYLGASKNGKSVLVWGGSSAVGSNTIQLATAAGYDVIATCSKRNFDYVKSLGAAEVFDYKHPNVTQEVAAELDKGTCAGIFMAAGFDVGNVAACKVAAASKQKLNFSSSNFVVNLDDLPKGLNLKQLPPENFKPFPDCWFEMTIATFGGYLPRALAKGAYKVAPPPLVVNRRGLEGIQEAVDLMRVVGEKGVEGAHETIKHLKEGINDD